MDVAIAVTGEHSADDLRSLRRWLAGDDDLNDPGDDSDRPAGDGAQAGARPEADSDAGPGGAEPGSITVRLDRPGAAAALADSLVGWIREHGHDGVYEVRRPDGVSVRLVAGRVRQTGGAMVRDLITELCRGSGTDSNPPAAANGGSGDAAAAADRASSVP